MRIYTTDPLFISLIINFYYVLQKYCCTTGWHGHSRTDPSPHSLKSTDVENYKVKRDDSCKNSSKRWMRFASFVRNDISRFLSDLG